MNDLPAMIWVEVRKALRSKLPLWITLGTLFMPLGITCLILLAKNPALSHRLGLVSAKADLIAFSAVDWKSYMVLFAGIISAGGYFFFIMTISWVFGREFADGTLKDMLAVPVQRSSILLAKFFVAGAWCATIAVIIYALGLLMGVIIKLPGGSLDTILHGSIVTLVTAGLTIAVVLPFAFFASIGRGYLLPMGVAILSLITANVLMVVGWAEYFPWAIPMLYAQGEIPLTPISLSIVFLTCLAGMIATYLWWKTADQNR